jgi:putative redox protein
MSNASVTWQHGLSFTGTADSGFTLNLGGSAAAGGDEDGFRPMELILIGLAGCTGMDVISILQKKRQNVTDFQVKVSAEKAKSYPTVFTHIQVHYLVSGHDLDPQAVERAIDLSKDKYCSVSAMLAKTALIEHTYEILTAVPEYA